MLRGGLSRECERCWYGRSISDDDILCLAGQNPKTCSMPEEKRNFQQLPFYSTDFLFVSPEDKERAMREYKKLLGRDT